MVLTIREEASTPQRRGQWNRVLRDDHYRGAGGAWCGQGGALRGAGRASGGCNLGVGAARKAACGLTRSWGALRVCRKKNDDTVTFYEFRGIMDFCSYCLRVIFGFRAGTLWWFLE